MKCAVLYKYTLCFNYLCEKNHHVHSSHSNSRINHLLLLQQNNPPTSLVIIMLLILLIQQQKREHELEAY